MYIKLIQDSYCWRHGLFSANHKMIYLSENLWVNKWSAVKAIRKLARRIGVGYNISAKFQENNNE